MRTIVVCSALRAVRLCRFCAETAQGAQKSMGCSLLRKLVRGAPCSGPVSAVTAHTTCSSHQLVITPFIMRCCSDLSPQQRLLEFW